MKTRAKVPNLCAKAAHRDQSADLGKVQLGA
jgi:hypothetical protein